MTDNPYEPPKEPQAPRLTYRKLIIFAVVNLLAFLMFWILVAAAVFQFFASNGSSF